MAFDAFMANLIRVGFGKPVPFTTRKLTKNDNGKNLVPSNSSQEATVQGGMPSGFGFYCADTMSVVFEFPATLRKDKRVSGSPDPSFSVVAVGVNLYDLVGSKI